MENNKPKFGDLRDDGLYYAGRKKSQEMWITKEQLDRRIASRKAYRRICSIEYKKRQLEKNIMDRNYVGKYNFSTNKYFIRVTGSGKEVWGNEEQLNAYREKIRKSSRRRYSKLKQLTKTSLRVGDQNPDNPLEYVCYISGNRPYFGTKQQLLNNIERRNIAYRKRNQKNRKIRQDKLQKLTNIIKRGTESTETNLVFWQYNQRGEERWVTKEQYQHFIEKEKQRKSRSANK